MQRPISISLAILLTIGTFVSTSANPAFARRTGGGHGKRALGAGNPGHRFHFRANNRANNNGGAGFGSPRGISHTYDSDLRFSNTTFDDQAQMRRGIKLQDVMVSSVKAGQAGQVGSGNYSSLLMPAIQK